MSRPVTINAVNGATDGLRWGSGGARTERGHYTAFRWTYDIVADSVRLFKGDAWRTGLEEIQDPELAAQTRLLVCQAMGRAA